MKFSFDRDFIKEKDLTNHLANIFRRYEIQLWDRFIKCSLFKCSLSTLTQLQFCKIFCFPYKMLKRIFKMSVRVKHLIFVGSSEKPICYAN